MVLDSVRNLILKENDDHFILLILVADSRKLRLFYSFVDLSILGSKRFSILLYLKRFSALSDYLIQIDTLVTHDNRFMRTKFKLIVVGIQNEMLRKFSPDSI